MLLKSISWLDYVVLPCRDLEAMLKYYRDALGLPIASERADRVEFRIGRMALALRPCDGERVEQPSVWLGFRVGYDQVDACYEDLKARGVEVLEPPSDQGWGHRTLFLGDPEGNVLEIFADLPTEHGVSTGLGAGL